MLLSLVLSYSPKQVLILKFAHLPVVLYGPNSIGQPFKYCVLVTINSGDIIILRFYPQVWSYMRNVEHYKL